MNRWMLIAKQKTKQDDVRNKDSPATKKFETRKVET